MIVRMLKTGVLVAVAVLGLTVSAQAQCSGGMGGGGGRGGGTGGGGVGTGGTSTAVAQAMMAAQSNQFMRAQMETNQYLAGMQAQHNAMLQQMHQRQHEQMLALRQASQNRKRAAAERLAETGNKTKTVSAKTTKNGPST